MEQVTIGRVQFNVVGTVDTAMRFQGQTLRMRESITQFGVSHFDITRTDESGEYKVGSGGPTPEIALTSAETVLERWAAAS